MALSITVNGGGTFSASMEEGPVSFTATLGAVPGPKGDKGDTGATGVVAATAPITYDSGTQTVGFDTTWNPFDQSLNTTDSPTFNSITVRGGMSISDDEIILTTGLVLGNGITFPDATSQTTAFVGKARTVYLTGVNKTGSTIAKGKAVYISGATGNKPELTLARADFEATSSKTIGITTAAIDNNAEGEVVVAGDATGLDTSAYSEGQGLYLSPTSAGDFVTSLPTQPYHGVFLGVVTRSNNSNGQIEVHIQNYQELRELSDVLISSPTDGQVLTYEAASGLWKNVASPAPDLSAYLTKADNLASVASASTSRTNLDVYSKSESDALVPAASTTAAGKVELATDAEAIAGTSTTLVHSVASDLATQLSTKVWSPGVTNLSTGTSGTGSNAGSTITALNGRLIAPNASTAGYATRGFNLFFPSNSVGAGTNYGLRSGFSVRVFTGWTSTRTDVVWRAVFGRMASTLPVPGVLSGRAFGVRYNFATSVLSIIAHDGTSQTVTDLTWSPSNLRTYEITCIHDGSGTISVYIDGTLIGTGTGAPTSTSTTQAAWWQIEIQNTSTSAPANTDIYFSNPKVLLLNG